MATGTDRHLLRLAICGTGGVGKSTLIDRLVVDPGATSQERPAGVANEGRAFGEVIDYKVFAASKRRFAVAEAGGRPRRARDMATIAADADLAVVLVDGREGLRTESLRLGHIAAMFGIREIVLAVNKMDLADHDEAVFADACEAWRSAVAGLGFADVTCIPVSALDGGNVFDRVAATDWYDGPTLVEHLASRAPSAATGEAAQVTDQFRGNLLWLDARPMLPGRTYEIRLGTQTAVATADLRHVVNVDTREHIAARSLATDQIGVVNFGLDRTVTFNPFLADRDAGTFTLIDRYTRDTVGAGTIVYGLRRASNVQWQELEVDKAARARIKKQRPCVLWFTGLSGSGKSTIANLVEKRLHALGHHTLILDGDNVRHGLNRDLGFTDADRVENVRRIAETSKLFVEAGLIVLVSFISPFRSERRNARELLEEGEFLEVFVDTPIDVCEARDPKGLYAKVRAGEIANFTGFDSPYEPPEAPEIHLRTVDLPAEESADRIVDHLRQAHVI